MTEETSMVLEVDCSTGESITRPMTAEEIASQAKMREDFEAQQALRASEEAARNALKASAKAKLIAGEPLTEEEASVLVI